jgi:hypothetical protein
VGGEVKIIFVDMTGDEPVESEFEINDPEFEASMEASRKWYAEMKEAGTPYWCIHEGRSVTHSSAYWRDDEPNNPIHKKHGVFCADCGGYIQEG